LSVPRDLRYASFTIFDIAVWREGPGSSLTQFFVSSLGVVRSETLLVSTSRTPLPATRTAQRPSEDRRPRHLSAGCPHRCPFCTPFIRINTLYFKGVSTQEEGFKRRVLRPVMLFCGERSCLRASSRDHPGSQRHRTFMYHHTARAGRCKRFLLFLLQNICNS
jgi:hypothetical protein